MVVSLDVSDCQRMDFVGKGVNRLDKLILMGDTNLVLYEFEKCSHVLYAYRSGLARTRGMGRVEDIGHGRINRTKAPHLVHYDLIGAQSNECGGTKGPVWNKYSELFSVLTDQAHNAPWNGARSSVTVNEQVNAVLSLFGPGLKMVIYDSESIIRNLKLVATAGGCDVRDEQSVITDFLQLSD
jgi:hypothetical protein